MAAFRAHDSPSPSSQSDPSSSDPDQHTRTVDVAFSPYGSSSSDKSSPCHDIWQASATSASHPNSLFMDGTAAFTSLMSSLGTGGDGVWPGAYTIGAAGVYHALSPQSSTSRCESTHPPSMWDVASAMSSHPAIAYRSPVATAALPPTPEGVIDFGSLVVEEECGPSTVPSPHVSATYPDPAPRSHPFGAQGLEAASRHHPITHASLSHAPAGVDGNLKVDLPFLHPPAPRTDVQTFDPSWLSRQSQPPSPLAPGLMQPNGLASPHGTTGTPPPTYHAPAHPTTAPLLIPQALSSSKSREDDPLESLPPHQSTPVEIAIPKLVHPSRSERVDDFELLLLGVVSEGAKSRVETQVKLTMVLARRLPAFPTATGREASQHDLIDAEGQLVRNVANKIERVGSWSHVKLPAFSAIKRRSKKLIKTGIPDEETLFLDVAVIRATEPKEEIFCCTSCQARERKRLQRKKAARVRPPQEVASDEDDAEDDDERRKIVLFNCGQYLNFETGELTLPTRITCYCRHHKEKKGFSIIVTLRDSANHVVATSTTPPIMITDDHKAAAAAAKASRPSSDAEKSYIQAASPHKPPVSKKSEAVFVGKAPSRRRMTEQQADSERHKRMSPYDSSQRNSQRRASGHVSGSPSVSMTPLTMSKPASPIHKASFPRTAPSSLAPSPDRTDNLNLPPIPSQAAGTVSEGDAFEAIAMALVANQALASTAAPLPPAHNAVAVGSIGDTVMRDESGSSQSSQNSPEMGRAPGLLASPPQSPGASVESFSSMVQSSSTSVDPHCCPSSSLALTLPTSFNLNLPSRPAEPTVIVDPLNVPTNSASTSWNAPTPTDALRPIPKIGRLIPCEGPMQGGIEVTILGEGFFPGIVCVFGDTPAVPTHMWSPNTLVCTLPPSASPGPCVVSFRGIPITVGSGSSVQVFTYTDNSDQKLMELALQVVGLQMTGRIQDAKNVAMRIVGESANAGNSPPTTGTAGGYQQRGGQQVGQTPLVDTSNLNVLAATLANAATSIMESPAQSRPPSRHNSNRHLVSLDRVRETRSFESIIIRFLTLLNFQSSDVTASPIVSPISLQNAQGHTLLHLAVLLGFHKLVAYLLRHGVEINARDRNAFTALHFAALNGRVAITRLLLDAGAATYSRNCAARTPLDLARDREQVDIVELFERYRYRSSSSHSSRQPSRSFSEVNSPLRSRASGSRSNSSLSCHSDEGSVESSDEDVSSSGEADSTDERRSVDSMPIRRRVMPEELCNSSIESLARLSHSLSLEASVELGAQLQGESDDENDQIEMTQSVMTRRQRQRERHQHQRDGHEPGTVRFQLPARTALWDKLRIPTPAALSTWTDLPATTMMNGLSALNRMAYTAWWSPSSEPATTTPRTVPPPPKARSTSWSLGMRTVPMFPGTFRHTSVVDDDDDKSLTSSPQPLSADRLGGVPTLQAGVSHIHSGHDNSGTVAATPSSTTTSSGTIATLPTGTKAPTKAQVQAKLGRRLGYMPSLVDESVMEAFAYHDLRSLKTDRMLYLFWIPVLCLALSYAFYEFFVYLKPFILDSVPTLVRGSRSWVRP